MLSFVSGLIVASGGVAGLLYMRPRNGVVHPLARKPVLDWLIPISIISAFALSVALIISALVG
jgi:hypothetical protein